MAEHNPFDEIDPTLYLDRWIAVVRGRVVGVGLTAQQAHRAAKRTRPKDKPRLFFIDGEGFVKEEGRIQDTNAMYMKPTGAWLENHPLIRQVVGVLQAQQIEAYLVGGAVRDLLLGRANIVDLDFVVPDDGLAVARQVANWLEAAFYPLDVERGTGRVVIGGLSEPASEKNHLDFATYRQPTLHADLQDRDFTINAMALSLTDPPELIDPFSGQQDLANEIIRSVSATAFQHDPIRTLRAVRQAVELGFVIESGTEQALRQAVPGLVVVSPERQRDELVKLLNTPVPGQAVAMLQTMGVWFHVQPEIEAMVGVSQSPPHHLDVFDHTVTALNHWAAMQRSGLADLPARFREPLQQYLSEPLAGNLTPEQLLPLALLWHDAGKPLTRTEAVGSEGKIRFLGHEQQSATLVRRAMKRLHFSNQAIGFVETVVANHMRPLLLAREKSISRRAIYRLFRDTRKRGFEAGLAILLHALADHRATFAPGRGQAETEALSRTIDRIITIFFEQREQVIAPPPLLTGRDLIDQFDLSEGRLIGLLLNRLKEAQAMGQIQDKAAALAFIESDPDFVDYKKKSRIKAKKS